MHNDASSNPSVRPAARVTVEAESSLESVVCKVTVETMSAVSSGLVDQPSLSIRVVADCTDLVAAFGPEVIQWIYDGGNEGYAAAPTVKSLVAISVEVQRLSVEIVDPTGSDSWTRVKTALLAALRGAVLAACSILQEGVEQVATR